MNNINIRPYNLKDRAALRTLCCDVADRGGPIENFFPDRDFAADLLTGYYTDYEPNRLLWLSVMGAWWVISTGVWITAGMGW